MWINDLAKAIEAVRPYALMCCIDSVVPCADGGITFYLSDFTIVKWLPNGEVVRKNQGDWRK